MYNGKKIGLALGGGGARGLAHVGVLRVLENVGIKVDAISGASIGAVIGSAYSLGKSLDEIEEMAAHYSKKSHLAKILDFSFSRESLIKGDKIKHFFHEIYGNKTFADFMIPVRIVVTNLDSGEEEILHEGSIAEAVRASSAIPGLFPPVKINDHYYIDGGVVNPTPVDVLSDLEMDLIIGVDLVMKRQSDFKRPTIISTLIQSYEIIRTLATKYKVDSANKNIIILKPELRGAIDTFKFDDLTRFIKSGEKTVEEALPEILNKIQ